MASLETSLDERLTQLFASDQELLQDSIPLLNELRERAPVHRLDQLVILSSYELCKSALTDPDRFSSETMRDEGQRVRASRAQLTRERSCMFDTVVEMEQMMTGQCDGDVHARRRGATARLFTASRVQMLEELTQRYTDELLDELEAGDSVVDIAPMTAQLPGWIIAALLGLPREDSPRLVAWGDDINRNLHGIQALEAAHTALLEVYEYVQAVATTRRRGGESTELFAAILEGEETSGVGRLRSMFVEMQIGGYETTRGLLGGGVVALMRDRDQWHRLIDDPSLATNATEELLRFVSPAGWTARVPSREISVDGCLASPDDTVIVMVAAANRDPRVFERPDELDLARPNARQHLALGFGPHYCIGQALARLEARIFFGTLARRFPELELAGPVRREGHANNPKLVALEVALGRPARS